MRKKLFIVVLSMIFTWLFAFAEAAEIKSEDVYYIIDNTSNIVRGSVTILHFPDGRKLTCVRISTIYDGLVPISCNWEDFNKQNPKK